MTFDWVLIFRLFVAGLLGGLIGLEREFRAKEAGVRTHFIVALGSALFMVISEFAFDGKQHDAARVAAQVVSGIGFIGAGVIIFQRNVVRGITTAAGLWVAAAIGLACGDGMYPVAIAATVLTVSCLEMMHFVNLHYSEKLVDLILVPEKAYDLPYVAAEAQGTESESGILFPLRREGASDPPPPAKGLPEYPPATYQHPGRLYH